MNDCLHANFHEQQLTTLNKNKNGYKRLQKWKRFSRQKSQQVRMFNAKDIKIGRRRRKKHMKMNLRFRFMISLKCNIALQRPVRFKL